jgi:hypothetical protein
MIEELREILKAEVALVKPIRQKIRTTRGPDRYDAWNEKRSRSGIRRDLTLALCWAKGTPYAKAERKPRTPPNSDMIANVLPGGSRTDPAQAAAIAEWLSASACADVPATSPLGSPTQGLPRLYVVVRADLLPGSQAVQAAHALREFAAEYPRLEAAWHEKSNTLVMLAANGEQGLMDLATDLGYRGVPVSLFREPDLGNTVTAICVGPQGGRWLRDLPLALGKAA